MITKVLVCGGREYARTSTQRNLMWKTLDDILAHYGQVMIIHGDAPGADRYAGVWAESKLEGVHCAAVEARWAKLGPKAGSIRNGVMLALEPHLVVAFPGGVGTGDMVYKARKANIPVYVIEDA